MTLIGISPYVSALEPKARCGRADIHWAMRGKGLARRRRNLTEHAEHMTFEHRGVAGFTFPDHMYTPTQFREGAIGSAIADDIAGKLLLPKVHATLG